jgi:peptidoglycan/LPS O-acetylase OafA/YrhL
MNVRSGRLPLFDSLRAIAVLCILAFHVGPAAGLNVGDHVLTRLVSRLDVGVWIFFVISGTLLYRPFVRARLRGKPVPHAGAYAWRRFLRIVPAYWLALTAISIWLARPDVFTATGIPTYYGFAQIYSGDTAIFGQGLGQAWSLCIEVVFYVFLPVFAFAMRALPGRTPKARLRGELVMLAALFLGSTLWKVWVLSTLDSPTVLYSTALYALPAYLDLFALGMGLALLSVWYEDRDDLPLPLRLVDRWPSLSWLVAAVAFAVVCTGIGLSHFESFPHTTYLERNLLNCAVAVGLVLPAVIGDQARGVVRGLLANRALLFLGLVSYGIFLYQTAVVVQLTRWGLGRPGTTLGFIGWMLVAGAATTLLASISYFGMERWILRLKRRVSPAEEPASAPAGPDVAGELAAVSAGRRPS